MDHGERQRPRRAGAPSVQRRFPARLSAEEAPAGLSFAPSGKEVDAAARVEDKWTTPPSSERVPPLKKPVYFPPRQRRHRLTLQHF